MKTYKQIIHDLENCSIGGPCQDCKQAVSWKCDWKLMHKAANAIRELLHLHELDQSEIVRLRRQIERWKRRTQMAEYIEREAAIEKLNKLCDRVCQYSKAQRKYMCGACPLGDAFTVIEDDIPAADVRPVLHGKWVYNDGDNIPYCSECMMPQDSECNFCPNCGADMREEN